MMRVSKWVLGMTAAVGLTFGAVGSASADGELHLYNWSNYFSPELLEKFEKETGIKTTMDNYASEEDLLAKLQAGGGGYDVIFPGPTTLGTMIDKGLVADIKVNQMENFKNVLGPFQTLSVDATAAILHPICGARPGLPMIRPWFLAARWKKAGVSCSSQRMS